MTPLLMKFLTFFKRTKGEVIFIFILWCNIAVFFFITKKKKKNLYVSRDKTFGWGSSTTTTLLYPQPKKGTDLVASLTLHPHLCFKIISHQPIADPHLISHTLVVGSNFLCNKKYHQTINTSSNNYKVLKYYKQTVNSGDSGKQ